MKRLEYLEFAEAHRKSPFRLIDVREDDEFRQSHVRGAEWFPLSRIRRGDLPERTTDRVALICRSGGRSAMVAQILEGAGWAECVNVEGGTLAAIALAPGDVET